MHGNFVTDLKTGIFNDQCSIFNNGSIIPGMSYKTNIRKSDIKFSPSFLSNIIKNLNPNISHGHDNISIKMIQICGDTIVPPFRKIFRSAINSGHFPETWKNGNIIPVHKKDNKNLVKKYGPISILPIFGEIFE